MILKNFLEGAYARQGHSNPLAWTLHNSFNESEFTYVHNNNWCQIDLALSKGDMMDMVDMFTYKEELQSNHKGIGVIMNSLFNPFHYRQRKKYILDWSTYDKKMYEQITEDRLIKLTFQLEFQQGQPRKRRG